MSKGRQPRPPVKVPKDRLSGKGCETTLTTRMLAQRQPSFKECVTAHWSSDFAPKIIGAKHGTEASDFIPPSGGRSGRGAFRCTVKAD